MSNTNFTINNIENQKNKFVKLLTKNSETLKNSTKQINDINCMIYQKITEVNNFSNDIEILPEEIDDFILHIKYMCDNMLDVNEYLLACNNEILSTDNILHNDYKKILIGVNKEIINNNDIIDGIMNNINIIKNNSY